jgi:hypothetical protein
MPHPWIKGIRDTGQLTVFNKATAWAVSVDAAIKSFHKLRFGVKLVTAKDEKAANIVLVLGMRGGQQYTYDSNGYGKVTITLATTFDPTRLHGRARTLRDDQSNKIIFAVAFLPGKIAKTTNGQKEVVVLHELIHACGLDEWHDPEGGIMYDLMNVTGSGLLEANVRPGSAKPMPPIRVGSETVRQMGMLWP